ncbi:SGNH hydrolase-type esterase domain-containing protein [Dendryphion nanum]|uniref:SGNH hydrolase-type esterase domain-containing protein n=1 Tax=Dendryphion nanum TaxID=256645 RepID=A0A9P9E246_9PLEO|nr:SGNH hydrolase-type esterase domain-containing protein [Dendryphion nanum]
MGDSFSAGPGAGEEWDNGGDGKGDSEHCMRRTGAYASLLQRDKDMLGDSHNLVFVSCTGDTTMELLDVSNPHNQIESIKEDVTLATLSIGGNDVLFGPIVKSCIYGAPFVGSCDENKSNGLKTLYSRDFFDRYNAVLNKILKKLQHAAGDQYTTLYQTSYIQFFDDWTNECDKATFHWWPAAHLMKKAVREEFNHMVHQLNEVLQY